MTQCPKCNTKVRASRLIFVTRWSPYVCDGCSARLNRSGLHAALLGGIGAGAGVMIIQMSQPHPVWVSVVSVAALLVTVFLVDWLLVPFEEVR